jgi:tetratricopeptide (TPR) repeat protein
LSDEDLNSYERAQMLNLYAFIYYSQDQYPRAITAYEELLEQEDLPEAMETGTVYTLAQLYFTTEDWRKAIGMMNRWLSLDSDPQPQTYEILAQAYYELEEYRNALAPTRRAIELTRQAGKPAKENSYLLLRVLYYELEEYDQVAAVLHELIERFPKKQYWLQLAGIYGELEDQTKQLNSFELAYLQGYLGTEAEVMSLAGLLLQNDLPYRAGKVLEKGLAEGVIATTLQNWRLLSQAWTLAQEDDRAIPALERAAGLSNDGELDVVLAQTLMYLDRFADAAQSVRTGLRKGGLDRPDQAQILLGQALYEMGEFDEARTAFEAAQADRRSRQLAAQWLSYVDSEEDRQAQLRAALE